MFWLVFCVPFLSFVPPLPSYLLSFLLTSSTRPHPTFLPSHHPTLLFFPPIILSPLFLSYLSSPFLHHPSLPLCISWFFLSTLALLSLTFWAMTPFFTFPSPPLSFPTHTFPTHPVSLFLSLIFSRIIIPSISISKSFPSTLRSFPYISLSLTLLPSSLDFFSYFLTFPSPLILLSSLPPFLWFIFLSFLPSLLSSYHCMSPWPPLLPFRYFSLFLPIFPLALLLFLSLPGPPPTLSSVPSPLPPASPSPAVHRHPPAGHTHRGLFSTPRETCRPLTGATRGPGGAGSGDTFNRCDASPCKYNAEYSDPISLHHYLYIPLILYTAEALIAFHIIIFMPLQYDMSLFILFSLSLNFPVQFWSSFDSIAILLHYTGPSLAAIFCWCR